MSTRIIIIGGGFAGLEAAFTLAGELRSEARITLIDRTGSHVFLPSIHEILSGKASQDSISIPLDALCRPMGVDLVIDEALSVDPGNRTVQTSGAAYPYDYLLLAGGAENNFYSVKNAEEQARRFRTLNDAERIRKELLAIIADAGSRRTIVLAGGGTEGVEAAGEIIDAILHEGVDDDLLDRVLSVVIVEGSLTLLPGFPSAAQEFAHSRLAESGVVIRTGARIAGAGRETVLLDNGEEMAAAMLIWTGGIQPSRLVRELDLPKDRSGWLLLSDTLRSTGDERIFGAGDAIAIVNEKGPLALQRLAYHAQDQGRIAGLNIAKQAQGAPALRYTPQTRQQLISIGKKAGIMISNKNVATGAWVVDLKKAVERKYLLTCLARAGKSYISRKLR